MPSPLDSQGLGLGFLVTSDLVLCQGGRLRVSATILEGCRNPVTPSRLVLIFRIELELGNEFSHALEPRRTCHQVASLREGLLEDTTYINNCQSSGDAFIRVQKAAYALGLGTQQVLLYVHTESRSGWRGTDLIDCL
ncbi:hypothetical protein AFLA_004357 [Aspergillus flavus NRRL3357]|nr:hypothetical protein AFLA_004357 [Aspergillus flavus NRRL3357]